MFRNRFIGPGSLSLIAFVAIGLAVELPAASAQTAPRSPADTLIQFYKLMRERHYREAFAIVGDENGQAAVKKAGKRFFLDARIDTHQREVEDLLKRLRTVEALYSSQHGGSFGNLAAVISAGLMPQDLSGTESTGYHFHINVARDGKSYTAGAEPARYGHSGKLSYWMDQAGTTKSADNKGQPLPGSTKSN